MVDCGINCYRLYTDMNRTENSDDNGVYGSPSIAEIKANPAIINWTWWNTALANASWWWYAPAFGGYIEDLKAHGIEPIICLRNKDGEGRPAWSPPQNNWNDADWNEWWEFCFAIAYWCNVRNSFGVTRFEVHNEPDLSSQGWSGTEAQYVELVDKATDAVRFANSIAGLPACIHAPVVANYSSSYVHTILNSADGSVDVVDYHTYDTNVSPTVQHVRSDVQTYNNDDMEEPIWVTEWGTYNSSYNTLDRGLTTCRQLYDFTIEGVEGLCIFPFFDWGGFYGLVSAAGAKTETYYAYRLMCKGLAGGKERLSVSSSNSAKKVMVTRDSDCLYVIAVDVGEAVSVNLGNLGISAGRYAVYEYSSSQKDAVVTSGSLSGGSFSFTAPASGASCAIVHPARGLTGFGISAWMPTSWNYEYSKPSFDNNLDVLTEISPEWYYLWKNDGRIQSRTNAPPSDNGNSIVAAAHANGILVIPMISNYDSGWKTARVRAMMNSRAYTMTHINAILDEVRTYGFDGIDVDYEGLNDGGNDDRDAFSGFIRRLSVALHAEGKLLSIAVHAKESEPGGWNGPQAQDWFRLGRDADRFRIMTYDYSYDGGAAGPVAPVTWVGSVLDFAGTVVTKSKTQMGVPFYGYDWVGTNASDVYWLDARDLIAQYSPVVNFHTRPTRSPTSAIPVGGVRTRSGTRTRRA
jgi:hypothetical protein